MRAVTAALQGPPPGEADPNKLVSFKPDNVPRKGYDADRDGYRMQDEAAVPALEPRDLSRHAFKSDCAQGATPLLQEERKVIS